MFSNNAQENSLYVNYSLFLNPFTNFLVDFMDDKYVFGALSPEQMLQYFALITLTKEGEFQTLASQVVDSLGIEEGSQESEKEKQLLALHALHELHENEKLDPEKLKPPKNLEPEAEPEETPEETPKTPKGLRAKLNYYAWYTEKMIRTAKEKYEDWMIRTLRNTLPPNRLPGSNLGSESDLSLYASRKDRITAHLLYYVVDKLYPRLKTFDVENLDIGDSDFQGDYIDPPNFRHSRSHLLIWVKIGRVFTRKYNLNLQESQRFIDLIVNPIKGLTKLERLVWSRNHVFAGGKHTRDNLGSIDTLYDHPTLKHIALHCATPGPLEKLLTESPVEGRTLILGGAVMPDGRQEHKLKWRPHQYVVGGTELKDAVSRWKIQEKFWEKRLKNLESTSATSRIPSIPSSSSSSSPSPVIEETQTQIQNQSPNANRTHGPRLSLGSGNCSLQ